MTLYQIKGSEVRLGDPDWTTIVCPGACTTTRTVDVTRAIASLDDWHTPRSGRIVVLDIEPPPSLLWTYAEVDRWVADVLAVVAHARQIDPSVRVGLYDVPGMGHSVWYTASQLRPWQLRQARLERLIRAVDLLYPCLYVVPGARMAEAWAGYRDYVQRWMKPIVPFVCHRLRGVSTDPLVDIPTMQTMCRQLRADYEAGLVAGVCWYRGYSDKLGAEAEAVIEAGLGELRAE